MDTETNNTNIFIDGKKQIIELLPLLPPAERNRLINNIRTKNPTLAIELTQQSLQFERISELNKNQITQLTASGLKAQILGLALKSLTTKSQKKVLSLCPRDYAEKAYQIMKADNLNKKINIDRARKIIRNLISDMFSVG